MSVFMQIFLINDALQFGTSGLKETGSVTKPEDVLSL